MDGLSNRTFTKLGIFFQTSAIFVLFWRICLAKQVPANFVFGDSLVDAGNNNYLVSLSKANYLPNGIDFGKPTGRYTNGRTIIDIIGNNLPSKVSLLLTYLQQLPGINYASGGGGILNHTGKIFGGRLNMDEQLDFFANTRQDIISSIGLPAALEQLSKALFSVTMGSNDFINNYLTPVISAPEQKLIPPEIFVGIMISIYRLQLTRLYNLGARKILVTNVGPIGYSCVEKPNQFAQLFNPELKSLLTELNANLEGSKFVCADVYRIVDDITQNYTSYGFVNANSACCHVAGRFGGLIPCGPPSEVSQNMSQSQHIFWDPYHPSDAANLIIARRLLYGNSNDISPINALQLIQS
ncbi:unnamed protein product [Malus baccata var. baccata]